MAYIIRQEEFNNGYFTKERLRIQKLLSLPCWVFQHFQFSAEGLGVLWGVDSLHPALALWRNWADCGHQWRSVARAQMNVFVRVEASRQVSHLLSSFSLGSHQKVLFMLAVPFPKSNNWIKKIPPRSSKWFMFSLFQIWASKHSKLTTPNIFTSSITLTSIIVIRFDM